MTKKQLHKKIDNFWYHYKMHVFISLLIILAVIPFVFTDRDEKSIAMNITLIGNDMDILEKENFQSKVNTAILKKSTKSEAKINSIAVKGSITEIGNNIVNQKVLGQIGIKAIDVMIIDKNDFLHLAQQGAFIKLDDYPELTKLLKNDAVVPVSLNNRDSEESVNFGIDITGKKLLSKTKFDTQNKVIGIVSNTKNIGRSVEFLQWFIEQK